MKDIIHCNCCPNYKRREAEADIILNLITKQVEFLRKEYGDIFSYINDVDVNPKYTMCGNID
jgi:hypothetical protein